MATIRRDQPVTHAVEIPPVISVAEIATRCGFVRCELPLEQFQQREPEYSLAKTREFILIPFAQGTGIMKANAEFFDRGLQRPTTREFLSFVFHYREVLVCNNIRLVLHSAQFSAGGWKHYLVAPTGDKCGLSLLAAAERDVIADHYDFAGVYRA